MPIQAAATCKQSWKDKSFTCTAGPRLKATWPCVRTVSSMMTTLVTNESGASQCVARANAVLTLLRWGWVWGRGEGPAKTWKNVALHFRRLAVTGRALYRTRQKDQLPVTGTSLRGDPTGPDAGVVTLDEACDCRADVGHLRLRWVRDPPNCRERDEAKHAWANSIPPPAAPGQRLCVHHGRCLSHALRCRHNAEQACTAAAGRYGISWLW